VRHGKQTECERDEDNRKGLEGRHGESALSNLIVKMEKWERDNLYRPPELKRGSLHPAWLVSTSVISFAIVRELGRICTYFIFEWKRYLNIRLGGITSLYLDLEWNFG
jgi:hypothetical protein